MIDSASLRAVEQSRFGTHFVRPMYAGYSFAQLPQTVRSLFTGGTPGVPLGARNELYTNYDAVILLFVDAFGWRFFERYADRHPFLRRVVDDGVVCKLTSQFPSTTSAHVTTMHTGLPVGQSGVWEWFYYEPAVDALIAPLLFSYAGDKERGTLRGVTTPAAIYPSNTFYQELAATGVRSWVFQHALYAASPYTLTVTHGATVVPFRSLAEVLVNLSQLVAECNQPAYYFVYYDSIDTLGHLYGPDSPQFDAEVEMFWEGIERILQPRLAALGRRTLLLITADHGQTAINPQTTMYLNHTLPGLQPLIRTNRAGAPLVPAGSSQDLFLYIREDSLDNAEALLREHLAGRAEVHRVTDLITGGFFGPTQPSSAFLGRIADLVVLPYAGESIWWHEPGRFVQNFWGSHGGLTPDEMETVLLALPYS